MFALPAINLGDFINHLGSFGSHTFRSTSGIRCVPCQHLSGPPRRPELNSEEAGGGAAAEVAPGGGEEPSMDGVELERR